MFLSRPIAFAYQSVVKPLLFRKDPELIHDLFTEIGVILGNFFLTKKITRFFFHYQHPMLQQQLVGLNFQNPIGLAAGFDKNAVLTEILPEVGFGAIEVGSVTGEYCEGNPKPRLWRLPQSQSLLIYYGLKNDGAETISARMKKPHDAVLGVSIAKTNSPNTVDDHAAIADYAKAYRLLKNKADYITINISCPNAFGGEPFTDPQKLDQLLSVLFQEPKTVPLFIKLSPDLSKQELDALLAVTDRYTIDGFICSNLTKKKEDNPQLKDVLPSVHGGMSGKLSEDAANDQIAYLYKKTNKQYILIGCGGVFSAEDAYKKIKAGASLIQLITGMIYEGPQLVGEINKGLVSLLTLDGYASITDAVGADHN